MSEEALSRYGSQKKLSTQVVISELEVEIPRKKRKPSPDKVHKSPPHADDFISEITSEQLKSKRKKARRDLKSATAKNFYNRVISHHNKLARV